MRYQKCFRWIIFLTGFLLIIACSKTSNTSQEPTPSPWVFHGVRIYIVSTGDIHEYSQNLASLATLVTNIRDTASYVYFVLAGDFFMKAGLYGTYAGLACLWWDTVKMDVVKKDAHLVCLENIPKDPGTLVLIDSLHRVYPHY
jgi:hypothetical protein